MKYSKIISVTLLSMMFLQGCNDDDNKVIVEESEEIAVTTIVDAAVSNGNFTTLVAALQATGLDNTLADTNSSFTVFAPTDDAFALLGQETIDALLADTDTLSDILTYHVIGSEVDAETAIGLAGTTVEMVNGDFIGLSLDGSHLLVNTVTVTTADIQTDNGIIHVIDAVLLPPEDMMDPTLNIVETAVANGSFTTLVAALQATDLDIVLADESTMFTVFAPTDDAFALIGEETITTLLENPDVLSNILLQHVIAGSAVDSVTAYSLNGTMVETASMATIPLAINSATDMLMFGGANIIMKDIYTTNGVIHVIDAVVVGDVEVPAPAMSLVDVAVNNGNFTTLVAALQSTGLDTTLADLDTDFTVFAPTDAAFAKLPEGTLDSLTADQLTNILLYHVLPGKVMSDAAITLAQSSDNMVEVANGDKVSLSFVDSMLFVNGALISTADVMADNGTIHVIDNVILPPAMMETPTQNIVEVALSDPDNFSTLVTALTAADLVTTLSNEEAMFTVFAPTNNAFAAIDPDALSALLADTEALTNVLLTHVIGGATLSSLDAYAANGKMLTTASGETIEVMINAETGMLMIGGAHVFISDIYTTNGVIHVIDTVILN
ncbi:fasciclin domain-containing protein [Thalassotalea castellviae]|uniref:Fasciclin domain-containing protein n=1 Tax=Thalassotalea castellviae TaxID=3075612 RepID=A0ABU3A2D8_9GAMM|nr:fasciclin domain-containing protein [Thalassotalea sp. W431]MDT0604347.1 fasciclin domain-containing protein [Thalassotalea sp. W431]